MDINLLFVWICFIFCLGLTTGGILVLFKNRIYKQIRSFNYLQYGMILLYTFGFYSLWSPVFFRLFVPVSENLELRQLANFVSLLGVPFLLVGLAMLILWIYSLVKKPSIKMNILLALLSSGGVVGVILYFGKSVFIIDVHQFYGILIIGVMLATIFLTLFSETRLIKGRSKAVFIFLMTLLAAVHLLSLLLKIQSFYPDVIFNFLFFLNITAIEIWFLYTAQWEPQKDLPVKRFSLPQFVEQYAITPREFEVVKEIYTGKTNKEIADKLFITVQTVKDHTHRIYQKTEVKNRTQLASLLRRFE